LADGLARPVYLTHAGDGSGRLFIVEQAGRVLVWQDGALRETPFLDIRKRAGSEGNEQGLLSVAFPPNFAAMPSPVVFANYTNLDGDTIISRFSVNRAELTADPDSEAIVLKVSQPYANHNGGLLKFGPDGMMYIGMGDGGSQGDPQNNAQNAGSLLGKILRVDVLGGGSRPFVIPSDNPEWKEAGRTAIWALGLRNPWRFSFDRATGDVYIGDVGQSAREEVNFQPAGVGGQNYGWKLREGFAAYLNGQDVSYFAAPIHDYGRGDGCSVIGGYVYRGAVLPALTGQYVYGDYCTGSIWALGRDSKGGWANADLLESGFQISSFGEDEQGELYVLDLAGAVYALAPR
jgi:glucose/arabinose dehydrogenase